MIISSKHFRTALTENQEMEFWTSHLRKRMDDLSKDYGAIDKAIEAIENELPENPFDLTEALAAEINEGDEKAWDEVEQVKEHFEHLAEKLEDEGLKETQEAMAEALAEAIENRDANQLEELSDVVNSSEKIQVDGEMVLSEEAMPLIDHLSMDSLDHLAKAMISTSEEEKQSSFQKAKESLQKQLNDSADEKIKRKVGRHGGFEESRGAGLRSRIS